mgnify:CR=1 FL=1
MAREFNPNRILHGNEGTAWFNGKKLTTLQSIEAKVAGDFEDINVCGDRRPTALTTATRVRVRLPASRWTRTLWR